MRLSWRKRLFFRANWCHKCIFRVQKIFDRVFWRQSSTDLIRYQLVEIGLKMWPDSHEPRPIVRLKFSTCDLSRKNWSHKMRIRSHFQNNFNNLITNSYSDSRFGASTRLQLVTSNKLKISPSNFSSLRRAFKKLKKVERASWKYFENYKNIKGAISRLINSAWGVSDEREIHCII